MKKMFRISLSFLLATAFAAHAQVIFEESFDTDGDISVYPGWVATSGEVFSASGGEIEMPSGGKLMYSGASASMQPGDSIQITVDHTLSMTNSRAHYALFGIGVQTNNIDVATDRGPDTLEGYEFMYGSENLSWGRYSGQMYYMPDHQQWNANAATDLYAVDLGFNPFGFVTNSPPTDDPAYEDPDSDSIRLVYTITKSHVPNMFNSTFSVTNLDGTAYTQAAMPDMDRSEAWASDLYFYLYDATGAGNTSVVQYVKMELIPPSAAPTGLSVLGLDQEISLSWNLMPGATQYDIYRSTTSGVQGSLIDTVSTESYLDAPVNNGTTYYYQIVAKYYNGDSAPSTQESGTPEGIYRNQLVYATDFSGMSGDLAADTDWGEITGSSNNAFAVINDGGVDKADTVTTEADFDNTVGNGVYLDRLIRNDADDAIEGYFDVVISVTADGTNDADHTHSTVMSWGLTGSKADAPDVDTDSMALFALGLRAESRLCLLFGDDDATASADALALWGYSEMGWNPKPHWPGGIWGGDISQPRDLETDPLRISWKIRKTREAGVYQAWASVSNLFNNTSAEVENEFRISSAQSLYDVPAALFSMAHYHSANQGGYSTLHVTVSEMSITHSEGHLPVVETPVLTSVDVGNREVIMDWDPVLDATGGYTITVDTGDAQPYVVADGITETQFTDAPRWNGYENSYTLTANFDSDLTPDTASTNFSATPIALVTATHLNGEYGSGVDPMSDLTTNATETLRYIDRMTTPMFTNGVNNYSGITLYGLAQQDPLPPIDNANSKFYTESTSTKIGMSTGPWNYFGNLLIFATVDDMSDGSASFFDAVNDTPVSFYLRAGSWTWGNWNGYWRAAIRNGTEWYVSDTGSQLNQGAGGNTRELFFPNVFDETWNLITIDPEVEMAPSGPAINPYALTNITAMGWFANNAANVYVYEMEVKVPGNPSAYGYWADSMGLVSSNSAPELDPDGDGIINEREYAFNGDPLVADTAELPTLDIDAGAGTVTATYLRQRDPNSELTTGLKTTADLTLGWGAPGGTEVTGILDYYWTGVTNVVPMGAFDAQFFKVDVDGL